MSKARTREMALMYFRRDGTSYPPGRRGMLQWGKDHSDMKYRRVALTKLPNGYEVSTVWLGLDHSFAMGPHRPLIFETMVFPKNSYSEQDVRRYSTEEEALAGHKAMVAKWKQRRSPGQNYVCRKHLRAG